MDDTGNITLDQHYTDADVWCDVTLTLMFGVNGPLRLQRVLTVVRA